MKPILFNTDMVRAILNGNKTVTRRVVKPQPRIYGLLETTFDWRGIKAPYRPGDILYVRETFCLCCLSENYRKGHSNYCYKASVESPVYGCIDHFMGGEQMRAVSCCKWHPSIHMPRNAARIFLRVTNVRVERLQDITEEEAIKEGFEPVLCDHPGGYPCTDCMNTGYREPAMLGFVETWKSIIKAADRALYDWAANPWVWVIEFERISKEEATK